MKVTTLNLRRLLICLIIPLAVGGLSALLSGGFTDSYMTLNKPPLSPPAWLFPVVWTVLYLLMGVAAYIITSNRHSSSGDAMQIYYIQLALNFLWPIVYFRLDMPTAAVFVLIALLVAVIITAVRFAEIDHTAALLLVPYIVWLCFALYLNIGTAVLN